MGDRNQYCAAESCPSLKTVKEAMMTKLAYPRPDDVNRDATGYAGHVSHCIHKHAREFYKITYDNISHMQRTCKAMKDKMNAQNGAKSPQVSTRIVGNGPFVAFNLNDVKGICRHACQTGPGLVSRCVNLAAAGSNFCPAHINTSSEATLQFIELGSPIIQRVLSPEPRTPSPSGKSYADKLKLPVGVEERAPPPPKVEKPAKKEIVPAPVPKASQSQKGASWGDQAEEEDEDAEELADDGEWQEVEKKK